uniref:Uncharacterized protein n=1 Tax=Physcomitrium patens TaxID=3218 RepID=A0A2K1IFR4_PHYPA|nr:hypothetical protein PHYPA_028713 [Physcomitrium patens]
MSPTLFASRATQRHLHDECGKGADVKIFCKIWGTTKLAEQKDTIAAACKEASQLKSLEDLRAQPNEHFNERRLGDVCHGACTPQIEDIRNDDTHSYGPPQTTPPTRYLFVCCPRCER